MNSNKNFQIQYANPHQSSALLTSQTDNNTPPKVDVIDKGEEIAYIFELPGIDPDSLNVNIAKDSLSVSAQVDNQKKKKYLYRERINSGFDRKITIPKNIISDEISADYNNGILEVKFSKENFKTTHLNKEEVEKKINN